MSDTWNAKTYSQFLDLRTRPARDLLSAFPPNFQPKIIYDLGCGPGNSTILLKNRWPNAEVVGTDSSVDMLTEAKKTYPDIEFIEQDIANFSPQEKNKNLDCLFSNAALQWLGDHENLFPTLLKTISPNGMFGFQMPNNWHLPSHQTTVELLQNNSHWTSLLKTLRYGILDKPFYDLKKYYDLLIKSGAKEIQLWQTEYFQEMDNHQAIFDWVKGTGLRPVLLEMDAENQQKFEQEYVNAIAAKYPKQANGKILLVYNRLFMVGKIARD
ncbi:MAG TPA: methyltransferase domain-containing protein [Gammaproteobacteria bacterium]|nr:methyltransferase domain-containing protein [Gammaproteobacteria bacterium]